MKVALIGDVHANLPALEAVLADAQHNGAEALWNLGDFLGYGPFPEEVVQRLRAEGAQSVLGNYDAKVLAFARKEKKWRKTKAAKKFLAFRWADENLSQRSRRYLQSLPGELRLEIDRIRVLLTHGSPAAADELLGPDTPDERLEQLAALADADVVGCGHSHRPFSRRVAGTWFINPGSVGRPEGGDPRASYALLVFATGRPRARHRRVHYDVDRTVQAIRAAGLPEEFAQMLRQGKNLDQVRGASRPGSPSPLTNKA